MTTLEKEEIILQVIRETSLADWKFAYAERDTDKDYFFCYIQKKNEYFYTVKISETHYITVDAHTIYADVTDLLITLSRFFHHQYKDQSSYLDKIFNHLNPNY